MNAIQQRELAKWNNPDRIVVPLKKPKVRNKLRWIAVACSIPFLVLLGLAVWFAIGEWEASRLVYSEMEQLRLQSQPLDNESTAAWFNARTHKEGTDAWLEVLQLSESSARLAVDLPFVGSGFAPVDITPGMEWPGEPRVAEYLEVLDPLVTEIHQACEYPKPVWLPIQWDGFRTLLPQLQQSTSVTRLLKLKAVHSLWKNQSDEALKSIKSILETASAMDSQAFQVTDFVCHGEIGTAIETINRSLRMDVWNEEQLATLSQLLSQQKDPVDSWKSVFECERALVMTLRSNLESVFLDGESVALRYIPWFPSDDLRILRHYQSIIDLAAGGMAGLPDRCDKWEASWKKEMIRSPFSASTILLGLRTIDVQPHAQAKELYAIQRQLALTAIAIKRFQKVNGRFPQTLSELSSPDWPLVNWSVNQRTPFIYEVKEGMANLSYQETTGLPGVTAPPTTPGLELSRANMLDIVIR